MSNHPVQVDTPAPLARHVDAVGLHRLARRARARMQGDLVVRAWHAIAAALRRGARLVRQRTRRAGTAI